MWSDDDDVAGVGTHETSLMISADVDFVVVIASSCNTGR